MSPSCRVLESNIGLVAVAVDPAACDIRRQSHKITNGSLGAPRGSAENEIGHPQEQGQEACGQVVLG